VFLTYFLVEKDLNHVVLTQCDLVNLKVIERTQTTDKIIFSLKIFLRRHIFFKKILRLKHMLLTQSTRVNLPNSRLESRDRDNPIEQKSRQIMKLNSQLTQC